MENCKTFHSHRYIILHIVLEILPNQYMCATQYTGEVGKFGLCSFGRIFHIHFVFAEKTIFTREGKGRTNSKPLVFN